MVFAPFPGLPQLQTPIVFSQHETIYIVDQEQQKQTNPANCQFHTSSQQGNIIFRTNGRMIMGAADRQKRIEQGDTECHGHNINQIVLHRPLCILKMSLAYIAHAPSHHGEDIQDFSKKVLRESPPLRISVKIAPSLIKRIRLA